MNIFSFLKKKDELVLVIDIGSSSVGASLFWMQTSGVPKIIFSIREPIKIEEGVDLDIFLENTIKSLKNVVKKISTKGLGAPKRIFCVFASLWVVSQTRIVKYKKDEPFVFSSKLADKLIKKEIEIFEEEYKKTSKDSNNKFRPIEFKNMKTVLNGYPTSNPLNKKASELEMSIFISMIQEKILKKTEEIIFNHFHTKDIRPSSFLLASFVVARDMFIHQDNFLLVDIGGEITNVSMIKKDMLHESTSFSLGRNFILRGIANGLKCSLDDAESYISLYENSHATISMEKIIDPIMDELKTKWLKRFQESLATLSNDISIPATIFVTVDEDFTGLFSKTIKKEQFNQYTLTESKFRVIFLGNQTLHGIATFQENTIRDAILIIESIYINRFFS